MFKLFLGVLSIATFYVHSAEPPKVYLTKDRVYVCDDKADGIAKVGDIKAHYKKKCDVSEVEIIQKGCNIPHNTSVQKSNLIKIVTDTYNKRLTGQPHLKLIPKVLPKGGMNDHCTTVLDIIEKGIDISAQENMVLEKDTEYMVVFVKKEGVLQKEFHE